VNLLLTLSYAAVAALLLNLNLASDWGWRVKAASIALVSCLYAGTWFGIEALAGRPSGAALPDRFRLEWVAIDEPRPGFGGELFFWVRPPQGEGAADSEPRAYRLPYDAATADAAWEAIGLLREGRQLEGRSAGIAVDPRVGADTPLDASRDRDEVRAPQPHFEFREVPAPALPAKRPR